MTSSEKSSYQRKMKNIRCPAVTIFVFYLAVLSSANSSARQTTGSCGVDPPVGIKVKCDGVRVTISTLKSSFTSIVNGYPDKIWLLLHSYLVLETSQSGALSSLKSRIYDLNDGSEIIDLAAKIVYIRPNFIVLSPTDVLSDSEIDNPTLYYYKLTQKKPVRLDTEIKLRKGCGTTDDLSYGPKNYSITDTGVSFFREDKCGAFTIYKAWPIE